jgi:hypothetical protein
LQLRSTIASWEASFVVEVKGKIGAVFQKDGPGNGTLNGADFTWAAIMQE